MELLEEAFSLTSPTVGTAIYFENCTCEQRINGETQKFHFCSQYKRVLPKSQGYSLRCENFEPLSNHHEEVNCRPKCTGVFLWTRKFVSNPNPNAKPYPNPNPGPHPNPNPNLSPNPNPNPKPTLTPTMTPTPTLIPTQTLIPTLSLTLTPILTQILT